METSLSGLQGPRFTLACVVDKHPRFLVELVLWTHCVARYLPRSTFDPVVYFIDEAEPQLTDWLAAKGFRFSIARQVVAGSPHSNKIAPFLDHPHADYTIVTDVDLYFVEDPACLFRSDRIRAAPNNHANPPGRIFKKLLAASGLNTRYRPGIALYGGPAGRETHLNNISAGITGLPRAKVYEFAQCWRRWAHWLVENSETLDVWAANIDQVAFCLAAEEFGEDVEFLPPQVNTILQALDQIDTVWAFHLTTGHIPQFPLVFNSDKTMNSTGFSSGVRAAIERLNPCIIAAVNDIASLAATRDHLGLFLNPGWHR